MSTCASPISTERLVAYWANDLDAAEIDAIDEHVFACETCAHESARLEQIAHALRDRFPPTVSRADVETMRAGGSVIRENEFVPDNRTTALFERGVDVMIHRLRGLSLADAERVDVLVRSEANGPMFQDMYVPFDVERGEVLIACQRHFEAFPADVAFDVRVHHRDSAPTTSTYFIPHVFAQ